MENVQQKKIGAGIMTLSIIQLFFSGLGIFGVIVAIAMKDQLKAYGIPETPTSSWIISLGITLVLITSIILILMKKELGIYIYFIAEVGSFVYSIVQSGFNPWMLLNLIFPVLMAIFLWKKRDVFSAGVEDEKVTI